MIYKSLMPYESFVKKYIWSLRLTVLLKGILMLFFPLATKILVDKLILAGNFKYITLWIIICLLASIIIYGFNFLFVEYYGDKISTIIGNFLRKKLINRLLDVPVYAFDKFDQGMLYNTIISETNVAAVAFLNDKVMFIICLIQAAIYMILTLVFSWKIGLITLGVSPLFFFVSFKNQKRFHSSIKSERNALDCLIKNFNLIVKNKKQIHLYNKNKYFFNKVSSSIDSWGNARIKYNFFYTFLQQLPTLLNEMTILLIYGMGALFVVNKEISIGTLLLLTQIVILLFQEISNIVKVKVDVQNAKPLFDRINKILFTEADDNLFLLKSNSTNLHLSDVDIVVNSKVLYHINNFFIDSPGIYLLQGANGTGKTYLLNSITGIVRGTTEKEAVINVPNFDKIGYLSSPSFFIDDTVLNNISFGEEIDTNFIDEIKNIFDLDFLEKKVTTNPLNLSLGQQQKISLSRFFWHHKNKNYWFIDEPLVNLDVKTINKLCAYIKTKSINKIIIIISHDSYFENIAKQIYIIKNNSLTKKE